MIVTRAPRSAASRAASSSSGAPALQGSASPTVRASPRRRSASVSTWCASSAIPKYGTAATRTHASAASVGTRNWRTSLRLERVGIELVPHTADGDDELRVGIIALDAFSQASHVDVHGARLDVHLRSPYEVEELEPIVHPVRVPNEELEELELPEREGQRLAVEEHLVGVEIHPEPSALVDLVPGRALLGRVRPAEDGAYPCDQLPRAERLRHVVVRAELEAEDAVHLGRLRGQHDDGDAAQRLRPAQPAADLEAVDPGQHQVEHDQRGPLRGHQGERALPGLGLAHPVPLLLQMEPDELPDVPLVLDHQDGWLTGHRSSGSSVTALRDGPMTGG